MAIKIRVFILSALLASWAWMHFYDDTEPKNLQENQIDPVPSNKQSALDVIHVDAADLSNLQRYDQELQQELSQDQTLEEAIALAKQLQDKHFGEQAEQVFSQQRQDFDDALYVKQLAAQAPLSGLTKEQALEQLILHFHTRPMNDASAMRLYSYAQKLYAQMNVPLTPDVNSDLAKRLLSGDARDQVLNYEKLKAENSQKISRYQRDYQQLLQELDASREAENKQLSADKWQAHKRKAISDFKRRYFTE